MYIKRFLRQSGGNFAYADRKINRRGSNPGKNIYGNGIAALCACEKRSIFMNI
jgi:hypothetical protein